MLSGCPYTYILVVTSRSKCVRLAFIDPTRLKQGPRSAHPVIRPAMLSGCLYPFLQLPPRSKWRLCVRLVFMDSTITLGTSYKGSSPCESKRCLTCQHICSGTGITILLNDLPGCYWRAGASEQFGPVYKLCTCTGSMPIQNPRAICSALATLGSLLRALGFLNWHRSLGPVI